MKRIQLIETGIIAIILILVYDLITSLFSLIINLLVALGLGLGSTGETIFVFLLPHIVFVILYISFIYLLVRYKKPLAKWINGKNPEETVGSLSVPPVAILHGLIIILCLITVITELPQIVYFLIKFFTPDKNFFIPQESYEGSGSYSGFEDDVIIDDNFFLAKIWNPIIRILFALIVLLFSKKIVSFWYKKNTTQ